MELAIKTGKKCGFRMAEIELEWDFAYAICANYGLIIFVQHPEALDVGS